MADDMDDMETGPAMPENALRSHPMLDTPLGASVEPKIRPNPFLGKDAALLPSFDSFANDPSALDEAAADAGDSVILTVAPEVEGRHARKDPLPGDERLATGLHVFGCDSVTTRDIFAVMTLTPDCGPETIDWINDSALNARFLTVDAARRVFDALASRPMTEFEEAATVATVDGGGTVDGRWFYCGRRARNKVPLLIRFCTTSDRRTESDRQAGSEFYRRFAQKRRKALAKPRNPASTSMAVDEGSDGGFGLAARGKAAKGRTRRRRGGGEGGDGRAAAVVTRELIKRSDRGDMEQQQQQQQQQQQRQAGSKKQTRQKQKATTAAMAVPMDDDAMKRRMARFGGGE